MSNILLKLHLKNTYFIRNRPLECYELNIKYLFTIIIQLQLTKDKRPESVANTMLNHLTIKSFLFHDNLTVQIVTGVCVTFELYSTTSK